MVPADGYTPRKIDRQNRLINAQEKVKERYTKIKGWLEKAKVSFQNREIFNLNEQKISGKRPHKYKKVWDLTINKRVGQIVLQIQNGLTIILNQLEWIDKVDEIIEKEETSTTEEQTKENKTKRINVEFGELRGVLEKFGNILRKIMELENRKKIIEKISTGFGQFVEKIRTDPALIYQNKKEITQIRDDLLKFEKINKSLLKYIEEESKLEGKEEELLRILVRKLKIDHLRFANIVNRYELGNVSQFMAGLANFETNLNKKEQEIVIYEVTPVILRLHKLISDFINLIKDENDKIKSFREFVKRINKVQAGKSRIKEDDRTLALNIWNSIQELEGIIKNKEKILFEKIRQLGSEGEEIIKRVIQIEYRREGVRDEHRLDKLKRDFMKGFNQGGSI